jgi:hypothetical protein
MKELATVAANLTLFVALPLGILSGFNMARLSEILVGLGLTAIFCLVFAAYTWVAGKLLGAI